MLIGVSHPSFAAVGGAEILVARQIAGLRARGHQLRLVTMALDRARWPDLVGMTQVEVVPKHWTDALLPPPLPRLRRRVARQAARLAGVDVVLASGYPANLVAARADAPRALWYCNEPCRRLYFEATYPTLTARIRTTSPDADSPMLAHARRRLAAEGAAGARLSALRQADADAVRALDCIVANSGFAAELVRRVYGREPDAIVHPTVPSQLDGAPRREWHPRRGLRVLVHSRLELLKNIDTLLHAFARFSARVAGAHELHIVGAGPDRERLQALAARLLGDRARFHGFLNERALEETYRTCDLMALVPPDEPFGMVFPEAALRGLLLLGPDHGGPRGILGGGAHGWTVDAFDPEQIAGAMEEIAALSTAEAECRREGAAEACRSRYCEETTISALLAALEGGTPTDRCPPDQSNSPPLRASAS